jgi:hypothetical protein
MLHIDWIRRLLLVPWVLAAFYAFTASPAAANQPQREFETDSGTMVLQDCGGGVVLSETVTIEIRSTFFVDKSGNQIRDQRHYTVHGIITNTGSGNTYQDDFHATVTGDLTAGIVRITGQEAAITAPGRGIIVQDTGLVVFFGPPPVNPSNLIFEGGHHDLVDQTVDLCAVLT